MSASLPTSNAQQQISALHDIGQILGSTTQFEDALNSILKLMCDQLDMSLGTVSLLSQEETQVSIDIAYGLSASEIKRGHYQVGEGITGKVVESGKAVIVPRISSEPLFLNRTRAHESSEKEQISFICVPILLQQKVVGTVSVDTPYENDLRLQETVRLLTIVTVMIGQSVAARQRARAEQDQLRNENQRLKKELQERFHPTNLIGNSRPMQEVGEQIGQVAPSDATVMLRGESGTGKELVADALHYNSLRANKPFVKVHIASLPETLIESELFGHERGAYTGASASRTGRFQRADGGTIFLDEIGELSPTVQIKLLRVLQNREVERLGGRGPIEVDVRVVAATHVDLEKAVEAGTFRADLFYRLNVFPVFIPPLRERKSDIVQLADHFLEKYANHHNKELRRISTPAIDMMMCYHWPGNVRELENCIERAVILSADGVIHGHHLPPSLQTADATGTPVAGSFEVLMQAYEREILVEAVKNSRGNMAKASRLLGTTTRILSYRLQKLYIDPKQHKS
ncbi:MAG: sigma 54-interacting transcriptional regulator [Candidatus Latescibacterota bacterium]|nr:sigma 54-interacting transcriptional regulator [Candidatus Latescibacterota bacterium]